MSDAATLVPIEQQIDQKRERFSRDGFLIVKGLLGTTELGELRSMARQARMVAGPDALRIPPEPLVAEVDMSAYHRLRSGKVQKVVKEILGSEFSFGYAAYAGVRVSTHFPTILFEPRLHVQAQAWHRDWRDNVSHLPGMSESWAAQWNNPLLFNQANWALYDDCSLWVVPGSHNRNDLPEEIQLAARGLNEIGRINSLPASEREAATRAYVESMPGGIPVRLQAGDLVMYRNTLWHTGFYSPKNPRATMHEGIFTDEFHAWVDRWRYCERHLAHGFSAAGRS